MTIQRGKRTWVALTLFPDEEVAADDPERAFGRSEELVYMRNERLCARLYWYKRKTKFSYEAVLKELQSEFDLSIVTITKIIQEPEWQKELQRLRKENPDTTYFKNKWPWMRWRG